MIHWGLIMTHPYSNGEDQGYVYGGNSSYGLSQQSFHSYSPQMLASYGQHHPQVSSDSSLGTHYATSQSMQGHLTHPGPISHGYQLPYAHQSRYPSGRGYFAIPASCREPEIEGQESSNEFSMASEAVIPALEGFPDVREFDQLMQRLFLAN